jgi:hypothetical protein
MGEFYAWTATGQVAKLKSWSRPDVNNDGGSNGAPSAVFITSKMVEGRQFVLHQRGGKDVEILLSSTEAELRNGEYVTTVWAAREGVGHGSRIAQWRIRNDRVGSSRRRRTRALHFPRKSHDWRAHAPT